MQKFELVLKNEKIRQYKLFAVLILVLNLALLAVAAFPDTSNRFMVAGLIALVIALFIIERSFKKRGKEFSAKAAATLLIIAGYISLRMWWPALIMAVLAILFVMAVRRLVVTANSNYLIFPSFGKRVIEWNELNNVILKDGLLTIDFRNNKIIQQLIDEESKGIDEKEFNDFCRMQLGKTPGPGASGYDGFQEMLNVIE